MNIRELVDKLNYYTKLYDEGHPAISDKEWDDLYFELEKQEKETGIVYPDSPTQNIYFEKVSKLNKIEHNHPMLSLDKTKDISTIETFLGHKEFIAMPKMDGLTCSLKYFNGQLISAETRGNGIVGENILHNAKIIPSIPNVIQYKEELIVDGEIICTYKDFEPFKDTYKNPRNFASGSIRLLDSKECYSRNLTFVAWDIIKGGKHQFLSNNLADLMTENFTTVLPCSLLDDSSLSISEMIEEIKIRAKKYFYPIDGIVFKYDNIKEYAAAGRTDHHFKGGIAYKFYDETYPTRLKYINWTMGRTGVLTPVAVFDPIEIDGTIVERASLHNVSIMRELLGNCAYVGEPLEIFKANQIIPQIASAGPKYDYGYVIANGGVSAHDVIEKCPICGGEVDYITSPDGVINAYCSNPQCEGKLINRLEHFCGKKGLDIKGLSKATFEKLIDWGWLGNLEEVFSLSNFREEWIQKPGFGIKSVDNILKSIEEHKHTTLESFISAIGIPLIGRTAARDLANEFKTYENFRNAVKDKSYYFFALENFGEEMNDSLKSFNYEEADNIAKILTFKEIEESILINNSLEGKNIVITGKLTTVKNRNELKNIIIQHGGKVTDSISSKTDILINNDINSTSSKNKEAKARNIPIMSELDFMNQYIENI